MKAKAILLSLFLTTFILSCSKKVEYSPEFIEQTSGRYLFTPDEIIEVYYEDNKLFLKWRGAEKIKPVILDVNTFFVADMYKKLRFTEGSNSNEFYLSIVNPDDEESITYDYLKLADSVRIPSAYLELGNYNKAVEGYLAIQKQDSTSTLIDEGDFNRFGYSLLREEEFNKAIDVFKVNVALYPESSNVYDSLADAYLSNGDSIQALVNYKKAFELNNGNKRAKEYIEAYENGTE